MADQRPVGAMVILALTARNLRVLAIRWRSPARAGLMAAVIVYAVGQAATQPLEGVDAHAYWLARGGDMYTSAVVGGPNAYLYSPAFAQLLAPLQALPWDVFHVAWAGLTGGVLVLLLGPFAVPAMTLTPVAQEVLNLNVHLLIALAVVVGFRWPAAWAFVLLTKVTPGIGLLWFAVRGEWRHLGLALGATALIAGTSFVIAPQLWADWFGVLLRSSGTPLAGSELVAVPLLPRLAVASLIVVWGARTDRPWTVPVAVSLALPVLWIEGLAVMVGAFCLLRGRRAWPRLSRSAV
jgi:hypothetical protein